MIAAIPLERQPDSTWTLSGPPTVVAANEGAVRSKLLTAPWEHLFELGVDDLPREVPDLRPHVPNPPPKMVVRVRVTGLHWPHYQYHGLMAVETPESPPDPPVDPDDPPGDPDTTPQNEG